MTCFNNDIRLEPASPADEADVLTIIRESAEAGRLDGTSEWDDSYPTPEIVRDDIASGALLVYREAGALAACVSIMPTDELDELPLPWTDAPHCVFARLCVKKSLQGRGLGGAMFRAVLESARGRGLQTVRHLCALENPAAYHMYLREGCREVGRARLYDTDFAAFETAL